MNWSFCVLTALSVTFSPSVLLVSRLPLPVKLAARLVSSKAKPFEKLTVPRSPVAPPVIESWMPSAGEPAAAVRAWPLPLAATPPIVP